MAERDRSGWVGTILQNKWRIEAKIARGGVATVFRAKHRRGQIAAIKIMHPEYARNPDVRSRFLREGYAANKVGHSGVVRVLDDDVTDDGTAYIVMELLEHGDLLEERREKHGGRLPVDEVARIADQILDVLSAAHDKGIVHRDIKPDNVFVLTDGTVKVLDFGIAHIKEVAIAAEPTQTGLLLGTPEFMSPEQAMGKRGNIDAQSDIYAVGATMFTLLSGEAVHVYDALSALLMAASTRQARSLASVAFKDLPREMIAVVDKALALEKGRRWSSARAMQDALRAAFPTLEGALDATRSPSVLPPPPPPTTTPRGGTMVVDARSAGASVAPAAPASTVAVAPPEPGSAPAVAVSAPPRATPRSGVKVPAPLPSRRPIALPSRASVRPALPATPSSPPPPARSARPSAPPPPTRSARPSTPPPARSARPSTPPPPAQPSTPPPPTRSARPSTPPPPTRSARPSTPPPPARPLSTPRRGALEDAPASSPTEVRPFAPLPTEAPPRATASAPRATPSARSVPPPSLVPPSDPTTVMAIAPVVVPRPPSVPPVSQSTAVLSRRAGRTAIAPDGDAWSREFKDGDMEGPTVAVTGGPLAGGADYAASEDQSATAADLASLAPHPAPPTHRPSVAPPNTLANAHARGADAARAYPIPAHGGRAGTTQPFASPPVLAPQRQQHQQQHPIEPSGWLPHHPRPPVPAPPVSALASIHPALASIHPTPALLAKIAIAILVVVLLSMGGCLLLRGP